VATESYGTAVSSDSEPWKPGDPLPDNATVAQLHAASVEEVKEWKRRKQGKDAR
jgi:hypothetical protein